MNTGNSEVKRLVDVVIRHPKEKRSKCSLTPLEGREDICFYRADPGFQFDATGYLLLAVDAPVLSEDDSENPLLLLDSTWRLLPRLQQCLTGDYIKRSLPSSLKTAYPRRSKIEQDPDQGLASVEALYAARFFQGRNDPTLLNDYRWRPDFISLNNFC